MTEARLREKEINFNFALALGQQSTTVTMKNTLNELQIVTYNIIVSEGWPQ